MPYRGARFRAGDKVESRHHDETAFRNVSLTVVRMTARGQVTVRNAAGVTSRRHASLFSFLATESDNA
jgi:hypothetical protein